MATRPLEITAPNFGPLLAALNQAQIDFVVVGPAAARARGVETGDLDLPNELDVTPAPTDGNLASLAHVISSAFPQLRTINSIVPISVTADLIRAVPTLPLAIDLGNLNILQHPIGAPDDYDQLLDEASSVELDGVPTLVPTIGALFQGLAGGAHEPAAQLWVRLRQLEVPGLADPVAALQSSLPEPTQRSDLEQKILDAIERIGHPATVRELLFVMNTYTRPPYKQVKNIAEVLTYQGRLIREKDGQAYRYRLNRGIDEQFAHDIADLLARTGDPDATIAQALRILAAENDIP